MSKNAKEMFEKLGFLQTSNSNNGVNYLQIKESKCYMYLESERIQVTFWKEPKVYSSRINCEGVDLLVNLELHKAINQQMIELEWFKEDSNV